MEGVAIRKAKLADLWAVRAFWEALNEEQGAAYPTLEEADRQRWGWGMAAQLAHQEAGSPSVYVALAEFQGIPIGFLSARVEERLVGTPRQYWSADHLFVLPAFRQGSAGVRLIAGLAEWAGETGVTAIEVVAMAGDAQWARRGLAPVATRYWVSVEGAQALCRTALATPT